VSSAADLAANTGDTLDSIVDLAAPHSDQEMAPSVTDPMVHRMSDSTIKGEINKLAEKLAVFCFEQLEEDLHLGYDNNVIDMNTDQDAFDEELQVSGLNATRH